jgi:hypothetical protein
MVENVKKAATYPADISGGGLKRQAHFLALPDRDTCVRYLAKRTLAETSTSARCRNRKSPVFARQFAGLYRGFQIV